MKIFFQIEYNFPFQVSVPRKAKKVDRVKTPYNQSDDANNGRFSHPLLIYAEKPAAVKVAGNRGMPIGFGIIGGSV